MTVTLNPCYEEAAANDETGPFEQAGKQERYGRGPLPIP